MTEFDPYEFTSGLVDEYEGEIVDATFAYDTSERGNGRLLLKLDVQSTDPELGEGGLIHEQWPVGKGWETTDKGKTATHESGQPKKLHVQSGVAVLLQSIAEAGGIDPMRTKGSPLVASTWVGGKFGFKRREFKGKNAEGEDITWNRMLVETVLPGSFSKAVKAAPKAEASEPTDESSTPVPPLVKGKLAKLAKEVADHDEFVMRALAEIEGVEGDDAVEEAVASAAFYESLKA